MLRKGAHLKVQHQRILGLHAQLLGRIAVLGAQHIARKALGHGVLGGREGHGDDAVATADQTGNGAAAAQLGIIGVRGKYQHVAGTPGRKKLVDVHCCDSW